MNDTLNATGKLSITLIDEFGYVKDTRYINNIVVLTGKEWIVKRMFNNTTTTMSHMAVGTSSNDLSMTNTILSNEIGRTSVTSSKVNNVMTYNATFSPGVATGILVEAGIFNASVANTGTMLARTVFSAINKLAADTLLVEWKITIN